MRRGKEEDRGGERERERVITPKTVTKRRCHARWGVSSLPRGDAYPNHEESRDPVFVEMSGDLWSNVVESVGCRDRTVAKWCLCSSHPVHGAEVERQDRPGESVVG